MLAELSFKSQHLVKPSRLQSRVQRWAYHEHGVGEAAGAIGASSPSLDPSRAGATGLGEEVLQGMALGGLGGADFSLGSLPMPKPQPVNVAGIEEFVEAPNRIDPFDRGMAWLGGRILYLDAPKSARKTAAFTEKSMVNVRVTDSSPPQEQAAAPRLPRGTRPERPLRDGAPSSSAEGPVRSGAPSLGADGPGWGDSAVCCVFSIAAAEPTSTTDVVAGSCRGLLSGGTPRDSRAGSKASSGAHSGRRPSSAVRERPRSTGPLERSAERRGGPVPRLLAQPLSTSMATSEPSALQRCASAADLAVVRQGSGGSVGAVLSPPVPRPPSLPESPPSRHSLGGAAPSFGSLPRRRRRNSLGGSCSASLSAPTLLARGPCAVWMRGSLPSAEDADGVTASGRRMKTIE